MADEVVGTAFVRIRPLAGPEFGSQVSGQVQSRLRGVEAQVERTGTGFRTAEKDIGRFNRGLAATEARALGLRASIGAVSGAFLGGVGLAALLHTATEEFSNMTKVGATTRAILTATGGAANVTAAGVQRLATQTEHATGIDDELVKSAENVLLSFRRIRNETGAGNDIFTRATRDATDLSRVFGQDVPSAARQLGRALADPERGVVLLRRAGVVFTTDQIKVIKALVQTGQTLKAQRLVLDQVERSVGGTAVAVGRTLPGQLSILKERAKDSLGEYVKRLSESHDAAAFASAGAHGLAASFHAVEGAVEAVGPPLVSTVKALNAATRAVGVGPILAAAVAYKAVGVGVSLATRAQLLYARAAATAAGTTAAEAATATAASAAIRVETGSLVGATAAFSGYSIAGGAAVATNEAVAASAIATGLAARASAIGLGASRLALAAVGGPIGAVTIGVAALVGGLFLLKRRGEDAAGGINATRKALDLLDASVKRGDAITGAVGQARGRLEAARVGQTAQRGALTAALAAQGRSTAAPGSLEAQALADRVATARARLTASTAALTRAEDALDQASQQRVGHQQLEPVVAAETTRRLLAQIAAVRDLARISVQGKGADFPVRITGADRAKTAADSLRRFLNLMDKLQASSSPTERLVSRALERIALATKAIPSRKDVAITIRIAERGGSLQQILQRLRVGIAEGIGQAALDTPQRAAVAAIIQARAAAARQARLEAQQENAALQAQFVAAQKLLKAEQDKMKVRKEAAGKAIDEARTAKDAAASAVDALVGAREQLAASQQALADAVRSGQDAVTSAVQSAKGNLRSIADTIAEAIGRFADAGGSKLGPSGPLSKRFQELKAQILGGGGGPETQRAAQTVAAEIQAQNAGAGATDVATKAKRRLEDLTDAFDRGRIKLPAFNRGLDALLRTFGLNLQGFGKKFGSAALGDLRDEIAAARRQAQALAVGPSRPGSGAAPSIVRPLDAVAQAQRQTRDATKSVERAQRDVARAQRELQRKQLAEERAHTKELKAIREAVQAQLRVDKARAGIKEKPKPGGAAGATADSASRAGASAP